MSKIKKFFARKKEEASAFKLKLTGSTMGAGHKLTDPKQEAPASSKSRKKYEAYVPPNRNELSNEARAAANAALARIDKKNSREFNTSMAAIKAQAKRELEAEKRQKEEEQASAEAKPSTTTTSGGDNRNLACEGVFFRCPMISEELLPKSEWKVRIKEFLYQQLETDRGLTGCLIIHNCNPKEKADECIATLIKYLENLINNPTEEKFCKIRMTNKIFSEKVRYVEGALDVLQAAGFNEVEMDGEPYLLWTRDRTEQDLDLPTLVDALKNSEIIPLELDRNIKVLLPSQARRVALPDDFFRMTQADIKKEQQLRAEAVAKSQMLMTKAMREREEQRNLRMYRYALVRVKFPNGLFIQGTFNVYEKISDVVEFVQSCLADESLSFTLNSANEGRFGEEDMEKTLFDCKLIPNSLMLFSADDVSKPVEADLNYLKEELLMLVQDM